MKLNDKIISFAAGFLAVSFVYLCFVAVNSGGGHELTAGIAFVVLVMLMCCGFYMVLKRYMQDVFIQLSKLIDSMTDMREAEVFSSVEDNVLSKLQAQVIKLSGILKMQNRRLEKEKREIKSLVSDIAHQLKNPLSNLNLYISFLKDEGIDRSSREEYVQSICRQLEKLNWLMESLIKMSRLESGIIQLNPALNSLNDVILTSIQQVYLKAEKNETVILFEPKADIALEMDKKWTSEAVANILDNAVKYTGRKGRIKITVQKYEMYARLDMEDNGPGLEEAELNNIFKRFYRGSNAKNIDGAGLGLYLAREIVTKQDGYIKVKSRLGAGSIFSVFLPVPGKKVKDGPAC